MESFSYNPGDSDEDTLVVEDSRVVRWKGKVRMGGWAHQYHSPQNEMSEQVQVQGEAQLGVLEYVEVEKVEVWEESEQEVSLRGRWPQNLISSYDLEGSPAWVPSSFQTMD